MNFWQRLIFILTLVSSTSLADSLSNHPSPCPDPTVDEVRLKLHQSSAEIPNPIIKPKPVIPLGCDRPFIYRNEVYSSDSPQAQDAANLKFFTQSVPEAHELLEQYQNNRKKSRISAYTGTVGILLLFLAPAISRSFFNPSARDTALTAFQVSGAALAAGGFFYSFTLLRTSESLVPKAVEIYNQNKKEDPIELKFNAGWRF